MEWLQHLNQSNVDNLNNVRREASRHFRNKNLHHKAKIDEPETNNKKKISGTCIGASVTSRRATSLELM